MASMKESLEVCVSMLEEDLFAFGLSLPHVLKIGSQKGKRVFRILVGFWLTEDVLNKPKWRLDIPVDCCIDPVFKARLRNALLASSFRLPEFFRPEVHRPLVEAFCDGRPCSGISRQSFYQRAIILLSIKLTMDSQSVCAA
jgi:hypothetical protein